MSEPAARPRALAQIIPAVATRDGAGVAIRRSLGQQPGLRLDPFLLLDEFSSDNPDDYLAGFPPHPHRGFETVTYMLDGRMRHEDHLGHTGELGPGGVQWMTAGRGIVHSEMPQQEHGRMRGFQLWLNLPAAEKMKAPAYRDIPPQQIPELALPQGGRIKVIAGTAQAGDRSASGPINGAHELSTDPLYLDVELPAHARFAHPLTSGYNAFVYVFEGALKIGDRELPAHSAGVLAPGDTVEAMAGAQGTRLLLLAGRPLREPVVQYGPFVMNTREQIEQALADYRDGRLTQAA
jgi:redox-sensitive bicupin YhaK (pirin superfamily)